MSRNIHVTLSHEVHNYRAGMIWGALAYALHRMHVRALLQRFDPFLFHAGACEITVARDPMNSWGVGPWMLPYHINPYGLVASSALHLGF